MIDFSDRTFYKILEEQKQRVPNKYDKREGTSLIDTALRPESWEFENAYMLLRRIQDNGFMATAEDNAAIEYKAAERGQSRKAATYAVGEAVFDIEVGLDKRFSTINGADSVIFATTKFIARDEDGLYRYEAVCETAGISGNGYIGALLPISGEFGGNLNIARLEAITIPGEEQEDNDTLKQKYWESFSQKPYGGNIASYRTACLDIDGVGGVQVYPHWRGGGTVLCSIIDGSYSVPSATLLEIVQTAICPPEAGNDNPSANGYGIAPIGAAVTIGAPSPYTVNVSMTLTVKGGYSAETVKSGVRKSLEAYLLELRRNWGKALTRNVVEYPLSVEVAWAQYHTLSTEGVANVSGITLNGSAADISLTETSVLQQLPVLGAVVFN
ncbi:MAG: baseplate J/gp47 family protein [Oscillospiraceae bacterium]|jgi:uncharacterized phage protein gp47/JayE|nr:baseplate J/gp47 family protein [Oscillospiraceae bacterium]